MRFKKTRINSLLAFAGLLASSSGIALAGDRGSMEDQMACTPDVYRLCSSLVPDEDAITACLKQNIQKLSPDCHKVFARPPGANDNEDAQ